MNNEKRASNYARQNGLATASRGDDGLAVKTVPELKEIGKAEGVSLPSKTRKQEWIDAIRSGRSSVDVSRLTSKQRKRLRLKGNREAA